VARVAQEGDGRPKRSLGPASATAIIVGSMIGSGILILPATMLEYLPSPLWVLLVFFAAAAMTVVGALTVAELAGMFPGAGGQYVYLREAYGPGVAYLFGWTTFWVVQTGTIAAVASPGRSTKRPNTCANAAATAAMVPVCTTQNVVHPNR
jgi:amino acid transporter